MSRLRVRVAALAVVMTCGARGQVTGAHWVEVDNSSADPLSDVFAGAQWLSQPGWRTFDLFITGAAGTRINGFNFGGDNNPIYRLNVINGVIFNHPGSDGFGLVESHIVFQGLPAGNLSRFDTYACFGPLNPNGLSPSDFYLAGNLHGLRVGDLNGPLRGSWLNSPGTQQPELQAGTPFRVLRITVSAAATELAGRLQIGLSMGAVTDVVVPDAIPAPGAVVLAAGACFARRRR